jgi:hypothetical protein
MKIPQLKNQIKTNHCKIIWAEKETRKQQTTTHKQQATVRYNGISTPQNIIISSYSPVSNKCILIHGVKPNNTHKSSQ